MERAITVLRFASSLDFTGELPPGARAWEVAERILAEASGRPVRTISKPVWPNAKLPAILERWIDEFEPDIVLICISSYWVETEVVANRIRRLGILGRRLESASQAAAMKPGVADSPLYLLGRRVLLRTVGGRPNFTPAELAANVESWLRVILRRESVAVAIAGTPFSPDTMATKPAQHRASRRKDELRARLGELGKRLGIVVEMPPHAPDAFDPALRLPDRVHFNEKAHARMGEIDGRALVATWERSQGER